MIQTAFRLGLTLEEFEDYTPRLLRLRARAYADGLEERTRMLAWTQANIMNMWRAKRSPRITVDALLGKKRSSLDDEDPFKAMVERGRQG